MHKTWNVHDQTKEALQEMLLKKYKEINTNYKMIERVSSLEDSKKLIEEIWRMKTFANEIEMELMKREYTENG